MEDPSRKQFKKEREEGMGRKKIRNLMDKGNLTRQETGGAQARAVPLTASRPWHPQSPQAL